MLVLDITTIVSGHGPVAGRDVLRDMFGYLTVIRNGARSAHARGLDVKSAMWLLEFQGPGQQPGMREFEGATILMDVGTGLT